MSFTRLVMVVVASWVLSGCGCGQTKLQPTYLPDAPDSGCVGPDCVCEPRDEVCNGLDDDCDGAIDEDLPSMRCGVGACAREVPTCVDGVFQTCTSGDPTTEVCNGVDDDCDGTIDNGLMPQMCGLGECATVSSSCMGGGSMTCTPGPASPETCNGKDDDCDGTVDEDLLTSTSGDVRLTNNGAASDYVYIADSEQGFGVVWQDKRDGAAGQIYFAPIDKNGGRLGADERVSFTNGSSTHPAVAWNGQRWGLVYADDASGTVQLYFRPLAGSGTPLSAPKRLATSNSAADWPDVVWTGSAFAVAYDDQRAGMNQHDIFFQRLDVDGNRIGQEVRVTTDPARQASPVLKWNGSEFGIVWTDYRFSGNREVYFRRLAADGRPLGSEVRVTNDMADSAWPDLAWNDLDHEWAVVWHDTRDGNAEVYFTRIDRGGRLLGNAVRLTTAGGFSGYPSIDWNGYQYGVSWQDDRANANRPAIYFAQVSAAGVKNGSDLKLSNGIGASTYTTALWNGSTFAFCWRDDRNTPSGNTEIYFAYVGCPQ